jgi:hypothetical protein
MLKGIDSPNGDIVRNKMNEETIIDRILELILLWS